jgi:hypothetical protein
LYLTENSYLYGKNILRCSKQVAWNPVSLASLHNREIISKTAMAIDFQLHSCLWKFINEYKYFQKENKTTTFNFWRKNRITVKGI